MKKIIFLIVLSLILTSCGAEKKVEIQKNYKIVEVGTGMVNENDNFIGYTKGIRQAMLATKTPGRITYMGKKIGDKVRSRELLASLDGAEAKSGYSTANKIVTNLVSIKNKTAKAYDEQIKAMEKKINSVKAQVKGATTGLEDTKNITASQLETAKVGLETAKTNLEQTKEELKTKKSNILTGAKSSLTHSSIISTNTMDFVEKLLGMDKSDDEFNNKIEPYLGKKDTIQLKETEDLFKKIQVVFEEYKDFYNTKIENKNPSELEIIDGLNKAKKLLEELKKLLNETYIVVDNSIENVYFSMDMINNLKKQITELGVNIEQTILSVSGDTMLGVDGSLENLKNLNSGEQKAISLLKKQVELAKKQVIQYEAMAAGQINNVSTQKEVANLGLEEIKAGIEALKAKKGASLREIDAKIAEAIGQRDQSSIMINNGNIIAPFSGIIVNKLSEVGQITNAGMPLYEIADNNKIKLKISVPSAIIKNLNIGEKLDVSIESLNKTFVGKIINLSKSANPITKKYEVEILLNNNKLQIPVGEMAIVSFNTDFEKNDTKINSLRIPNNSIIEKFMVPGVYVLEGKRVKFKKIEIIKMGEFYSEIKGLEVGEKVITSGKENIFDGEILK